MTSLERKGNELDNKLRALIKDWHECQDPEQKELYWKASRQVDDELQGIIRQMVTVKKSQELKRHDAQHSYIYLDCNCLSRFDPTATVTCIMLKDYVEGQIKCDKCGEPLMTKEDRELEFDLLEMGVNIQ
jgi:formylmethanofuran dehydrogenase subunit E